MFHSAHYAGIELCPSFAAGESWKKVLGPVFIYLNSAPSATPASSLWQNAQAQVTTEMTAWPYSWPASTDFSKAAERGSVCGRLLVSDPYELTSLQPRFLYTDPLGEFATYTFGNAGSSHHPAHQARTHS